MSNLVSPDQMMGAAIEHMLDGREPVTLDDQGLLVNFLAVNIDTPVAASAIRLMRTLYPERLGQVTDDQIEAIVVFQANAERIPIEEVKP